MRLLTLTIACCALAFAARHRWLNEVISLTATIFRLIHSGEEQGSGTRFAPAATDPPVTRRRDRSALQACSGISHPPLF